MAESSVITVVPNLNNSFKLSAAGNLVGSINQDRSTGVFGQLGDKPRMVPVRMTVHTSRNKTEVYNFEIVSDPFLTPLLTRMTMFSAIAATERQMGSQTLKLTGRIAINGQPDIVLDNSFSSANGAAMFAVNAVAQPLAVLFNSGFNALDLKGIDIDVTSTDTRSSGSLNRLWIDKTEVRRGESIEMQAFARNDNGSEFVERIPLVIPADAPIGPLVIIVGDGASLNHGRSLAAVGRFLAERFESTGARNQQAEEEQPALCEEFCARGPARSLTTKRCRCCRRRCLPRSARANVRRLHAAFGCDACGTRASAFAVYDQRTANDNHQRGQVASDRD